jgi:hypothetical protein
MPIEAGIDGNSKNGPETVDRQTGHEGVMAYHKVREARPLKSIPAYKLFQ